MNEVRELFWEKEFVEIYYWILISLFL